MLAAYIVRLKWIAILLAVYFLALVFNALGIGVWLPGCLVTDLTGYHCLGCGLNRAAIALLQGDIISAFHHNPLIFPYILGAAFWLWSDYRKFIINR